MLDYFIVYSYQNIYWSVVDINVDIVSKLKPDLHLASLTITVIWLH